MKVFVSTEILSQKSEETFSDSILEKIWHLKNKIGKTPFVYIDSVNGSSIYAKLEYYNPLSHSVKDRPAVYMIEAAIKEGLIKSNENTLIEASSGNLGIAYGRAGNYLGLKTLVVIPSIVGENTFNRIKATGTFVEKTPDGYCPRRGERDGALAKVKDIYLDNQNITWLDQYSNNNNYKAHFEGTGSEIWYQSKKQVTNIVLGVGTGGTIIGISKYLKSENPEIRTTAVQPQTNHHIQGLRNFSESLEPELVRLNKDEIDQWSQITDLQAFKATLYLWKKGFYVGTSSGLNYFAARNVAKENKDSTVVTIFPDSCLNSFKLMQKYILSRIDN